MEVAEVAAPPDPLAGEVLVKLKGIGICGSDLHYYLDGKVGTHGLHFPAILGHEPVGEVVATGRGVDGLAAGQLVGVVTIDDVLDELVAERLPGSRRFGVLAARRHAPR